MEILSFLTVPAIIAASSATGEESKSALPIFKRRWWYRHDRLDARPVAWSLRNRPEEWQWGETGSQYTVVHIPSKHVFWIANGRGFYGLYEANCSCLSSTRGKFQLFQQGHFGRAFKHWRRHHGTPPVDEHFASHFLTDRRT